MNSHDIKQLLQYLKKQIQNESISTAEIAQLHCLKDFIDPSDTLLLQWAGVEEFKN